MVKFINQGRYTIRTKNFWDCLKTWRDFLQLLIAIFLTVECVNSLPRWSLEQKYPLRSTYGRFIVNGCFLLPKMLHRKTRWWDPSLSTVRSCFSWSILHNAASNLPLWVPDRCPIPESKAELVDEKLIIFWPE